MRSVEHADEAEVRPRQGFRCQGCRLGRQMEYSDWSASDIWGCQQKTLGVASTPAPRLCHHPKSQALSCRLRLQRRTESDKACLSFDLALLWTDLPSSPWRSSTAALLTVPQSTPTPFPCISLDHAMPSSPVIPPIVP